MRVSTDPTDPAYIDDRPRRVWSNDREIADWAVADEFRRCVITRDGTVHNGAVLIERLTAAEAEPQPAVAAATPLNSFAGMFEPVTAEPEPAKPAPAKRPAQAKHKPKRSR